MILKMEAILFKHKLYEIIETLAENEQEITQLVKRKNRYFVIKAFKNIDAFYKHLETYHVFKKAGIHIPKLLRKDKKAYMLLFPYMNGDYISDLLLNGDLDDKYFKELFDMNAFMKAAGIELDFHPDNFMYYDKTLYYMSDKYSKLSNKNVLVEDGIRFWVPSKEGIQYLKTIDPTYTKTPLSSAELNKMIVLLSIKYWW